MPVLRAHFEYATSAFFFVIFFCIVDFTVDTQ
jgi:hypothetical protein